MNSYKTKIAKLKLIPESNDGEIETGRSKIKDINLQLEQLKKTIKKKDDSISEK